MDEKTIARLNRACPALSGVRLGDLAATLERAVANAQRTADEAAAISAVRTGYAKLQGTDTAAVRFTDHLLASVTSTLAGPYDLTGVGTGGTIIFTPAYQTAQTAAIDFTAGTSVSGATAATDLTNEVDAKFMISVDGSGPEEVTLDTAACDSGANIATEMEDEIQALGGVFAGVTVAYDSGAGTYTITSGTLGSGSSVEITRAADANITEELELGPDGGTETPGTGDVANAAEATAEEIAAAINVECTGVIASADEDGKLVLTGDADEDVFRIVLGAGTLNNVLGLAPGAHNGARGLGYPTDMADNTYMVLPVFSGATAAELEDHSLSVNTKTVEGFTIVCEDNTATNIVEFVIFGRAAAVSV